MKMYCDACGHDGICLCQLSDDPTDAAMEILEMARTMVLEVAEVTAPGLRWPYYVAARSLSDALLHVVGFDGPVGA